MTEVQEVELEWKEVGPHEWEAFYNVGYYRVKQTRGGVFPKYELSFRTHEIPSPEHAKWMASQFAKTLFRRD